MTAILLTLLFSFFVESVKLEKKIDEARIEITSREYMQMRLQGVLGSIVRDRSSLYTQRFPDEKRDSLVALFDNGIDPDPAFSGSVLGRIYQDEENRLCLALWPMETGKKQIWRKEILLSRVSDFEFEFLGPKKGDARATGTSSNGSLGFDWILTWPKSRVGIPSIIRLSVWEKESDPLQFAFIIPSIEPIATYRGFPS